MRHPQPTSLNSLPLSLTSGPTCQPRPSSFRCVHGEEPPRAVLGEELPAWGRRLVGGDLGSPTGKDGAGTVHRGTWAHRPRTWIEMPTAEDGVGLRTLPSRDRAVAGKRQGLCRQDGTEACAATMMGQRLAPPGWDRATAGDLVEARATGKELVPRRWEGGSPHVAGMGPRRRLEGAHAAV